MPSRVEGAAQAQWVLMDYLDVVVHIFVPELRGFYALERLWGEVPARAVEATATAETARARPCGREFGTARTGASRCVAHRDRPGLDRPAPMANLSIFSGATGTFGRSGQGRGALLAGRVPVVVALAVFAATPVFALAANPSTSSSTPRRIAAAATRRRR